MCYVSTFNVQPSDIFRYLCSPSNLMSPQSPVFSFSCCDLIVFYSVHIRRVFIYLFYLFRARRKVIIFKCPNEYLVTPLRLSGAQPRVGRQIVAVRRSARRPDLGVLIPQSGRFLHCPTLVCWHFAAVHPTKIVLRGFVHVPLGSRPNDS